MFPEVNEQLNGITQSVNTSSKPEKVIRYTLDLTRDYHNMLTLSTESEGRNQADNYFYDFNVVGISRAVGDDYFIQDDMRSPMSVINERGDLEEAYAYDEFGQEYDNIIDARDIFKKKIPWYSDGQDDVADYLSNYVQKLQKSLGCDVSLN